MIQDLVGRLAYSKAGRDKGKLFVVVSTDTRGYYALADGDARSFERPKWKNPKHVQLTDTTIEEIANYNPTEENQERHLNKVIKIKLETEESAGKEVK